MRKLTLALVLVVLVLPPLIAEEAATPPPEITIQVVCTEAPLSLELERDTWRILDGEELISVLAEIDAGPGADIDIRGPTGDGDRVWNLSALERVRFVQDYEAHQGELKKIRATLKAGMVGQFTTASDPEKNAGVVGAKITIAELLVPIQVFNASISSAGPPMLIELPELAIRKVDESVSLEAGQSAILPIGKVGRQEPRQHRYLLIRANAASRADRSAEVFRLPGGRPHDRR